jgi:hypothetical protein
MGVSGCIRQGEEEAALLPSSFVSELGRTDYSAGRISPLEKQSPVRQDEHDAQDFIDEQLDSIDSPQLAAEYR